MAFNIAALDDKLTNMYEDYCKDVKDRDTYLRMLAKELDDEFQKGTPSMKNVDITKPTAGLLFFEAPDNVADWALAKEIAQKVAAYWTAMILPTGSPQVGVSIAAVVNTGALLYPLIYANLRLIPFMGPVGTYSEFLKAIFDPIKSSLTWTVTELNPEGTPIVLPGITVS